MPSQDSKLSHEMFNQSPERRQIEIDRNKMEFFRRQGTDFIYPHVRANFSTVIRLLLIFWDTLILRKCLSSILIPICG